MKSVILTKISNGKPPFKNLIGLKPVEIDDFVKKVAKSIHKNSSISISEDGLTLNVTTNKALYQFKNYSGQYILRIGERKTWYKIS